MPNHLGADVTLILCEYFQTPIARQLELISLIKPTTAEGRSSVHAPPELRSQHTDLASQPSRFRLRQLKSVGWSVVIHILKATHCQDLSPF
jgi:hypothetical protein